MIDPELREMIAPELDTGEKLLWVGKPNGFPLTVRDIIGIAVLILMVIVGIVFPAPIWFRTIFVLICLSLMLNSIDAFSTFYGLSNRRGFIGYKFPFRHVNYLDKDDLSTVTLKKGGQIGTLKFEANYLGSCLFYKIDYPKDVIDIIKTQILNSPEQSS